MTVAKFTQPDASAQTGTQYKANIDASIQVIMQLAANFAPHAIDVPDMTVAIDAGKLWNGKLYISNAQQITSAFTAPTTNPRIDRIAIDITTGAYVVIPGTEAATPVAPTYAGGQYPICQVVLSVGQSSITNTDIIDERPLIQKPLSNIFVNDSSGYDCVSITQFSSSNISAKATWNSVGAPGSGADIIWSALSLVPANADWIEISGGITASNSSGNAADIWFSVRRNGTSVIAQTRLAQLFVTIGGATSVSERIGFNGKIPMNNGLFDIYYDSTNGNGNNFDFVITGYGYN